MPLPPLPFNNTDIAWLKYTSMGVEHELMFRQPPATPQIDIIANATALATALKPFMKTTDSFIGLRHQDSGSTLSFPLAFTAIAGTGTFTPDNNDKPRFESITGRSLGGYRSRITFFTAQPADALGYRLAGVSPLQSAVQAMEPPAVAVDGLEVVWNNYLNIGYNAYWQRQSRTN